MGVLGLRTYIEKQTSLLEDLPFRDSKLIIDGCNLYHELYFQNLHIKLDLKHGGEYEAFEDLITEFFSILRDCDIQPYVVIDGGGDYTDRKFAILKRRSEEEIIKTNKLSTGRKRRSLPLLTKYVFAQTLHKLKVPFVQCYEDDGEIAALANQWNCPVLSNDSDFYIFDLKAGFLPTQHFCWEYVDVNTDTNQKYIPSKHFKVESLCASFNIMNKDLLPVFACIHDIMELQKMALPGINSIDGLLEWLSRFRSPEEAIDGFLKRIKYKKKKYVVRKALFNGIQEYKLTKSSLAQFFNSETQIACTGPLQALPAWILMHLHEGKMGSFIIYVLLQKRVMLNPQVEDFQQPSSHKISRPIRQVLYGLVLLGKQQTVDKHVAAAKTSTATDKCYVTEYDREGLTLTSSEVEAIETKVKEGLQLETLPEEPHALRLQIFLETLGVPSVTFRGLSLHLQFQVFVMRYWLVNAQPQPNLVHLWGLLLGMVHGQLNTTARAQIGTDFFVILWGLETRLKLKTQANLDHEVAHLYSQWQSCLWWSLCLNRLLCCPLPEPECARLYQGTLVHHAAREFKRGIKPESLLPMGSEAEKLFRQMRDAVLSLVDEDVVRRISTRYRNRAVGNRCNDLSAEEPNYEHLMQEDIEDYDDDDDDDDDDDGKQSKAKDHKKGRSECFYTIRTRHKAKARNANHPSKKSERRCFD
ncbi:single-strand DNA endonuclease ASTE1-like [Paramisgurnus dabryanus]|uniref:single-strand DNA endonuclease ASTE1-like n=1 Tax=Paramisgurnus dabryanus TaxID=90735 RepID=UPI003CCFAE38